MRDESGIHSRWVTYTDAKTQTWFRIDSYDGDYWIDSAQSLDNLVDLVCNITCGKFFFGGTCIYFEQEKDAVMFRLKYTNKI